MDTNHQELVIHSFQGGRFADNGIDLEVLSELTIYKQILVETAKGLWRQRNPDRQRLPRNFEENIILKFYEVRPGSVQIPIVREFPPGAQVPIHDEVDEAAELVASTMQAADKNLPLPSHFPKSVLPLFENYGKTLRPDESFDLYVPKMGSHVKYSPKTRDRILHWAEADYDDAVDLVGTVLMARVNKPRMAIELEGGPEIEAAFPQGDEEKILEALKDHNHAKIRVVGRGSFSPNGDLARISSIDRVELLPKGAVEFVQSAKPIWDEFDEIISTIPEEVLKTLPHDAAENHDRYLYGGSKEEQ